MANNELSGPQLYFFWQNGLQASKLEYSYRIILFLTNKVIAYLSLNYKKIKVKQLRDSSYLCWR